MENHQNAGRGFGASVTLRFLVLRRTRLSREHHSKYREPPNYMPSEQSSAPQRSNPSWHSEGNQRVATEDGQYGRYPTSTGAASTPFALSINTTSTRWLKYPALHRGLSQCTRRTFRVAIYGFISIGGRAGTGCPGTVHHKPNTPSNSVSSHLTLQSNRVAMLMTSLSKPHAVLQPLRKHKFQSIVLTSWPNSRTKNTDRCLSAT